MADLLENSVAAGKKKGQVVCLLLQVPIGTAAAVKLQTVLTDNSFLDVSFENIVHDCTAKNLVSG